jgi:hypothetical protein
MQRGRGGRVPGAEGYSREDVSALLASIRRILPTGANEWERVLERYRRTHAVPHGRALRNVSPLKTKYRNLINSKKSTGDPLCPPEEREMLQQTQPNNQLHPQYYGPLEQKLKLPSMPPASRIPSPICSFKSNNSFCGLDTADRFLKNQVCGS